MKLDLAEASRYALEWDLWREGCMESEAASAQSGYLGILHRDAANAGSQHRLIDFIAGFKHALLFTPRVILADHMMFAPNFERAWRGDEGFR